jgi:hypothetical protein
MRFMFRATVIDSSAGFGLPESVAAALALLAGARR